MLSALGIVLRNIRMRRGELLKDMAATLDVTSSFLSAVENGKKNAPISWIDVIVKHYQLEGDESQALEAAFAETNKEIYWNLHDYNSADRSLAFSFARNFSHFSEQDLDEIRKIMTRNKEV